MWQWNGSAVAARALHLTLLGLSLYLFFISYVLLNDRQTSWPRSADQSIGIGEFYDGGKEIMNGSSAKCLSAAAKCQSTQQPLTATSDNSTQYGYRTGYLSALRQLFQHQLNWTAYRTRRSYDANFTKQLFHLSLPLIANDWRLPLRSTRRPPIDIVCKRNDADPNHVATSRPLRTPRLVVDFIVMSHEIDMLEVRLWELATVVDQFVIMESSRTHRGDPKPYYLNETLKTADGRRRFRPFLGKIKHFMADDRDYRRFDELTHRNASTCSDGADCWSRIDAERHILYAWYRETVGEPNAQALLIHGDLDELPKSDAVAQLRHCEITNPIWHDKQPAMIVGNLLFYKYSFRWLFQSDLPAPGYDASLRFPLFFNRAAIRDEASRHLNKSQKLLRNPSLAGLTRVAMPVNSGAHMTYFFGILPLVLKSMSIGEGGSINVAQLLKEGRVEQYWSLLLRAKYSANWLRRIRPAERTRLELRQEPWVPWLVRQNVERYRDIYEAKGGGSLPPG